MNKKFQLKAFTLMEIIVTMIIIGIFAAATIPSFLVSIEQAHARDAQTNLIAVYSAQLNYKNNNGVYCGATSCGSLSAINSALSLSIIDNGWTYACIDPTTAFSCTATRVGNANFKVRVTNADVATTASLGSNNPDCYGQTSAAYQTYCPY